MENANKKNLAIVRQLHQAMTIIFDMPMPPSPVIQPRAPQADSQRQWSLLSLQWTLAQRGMRAANSKAQSYGRTLLRLSSGHRSLGHSSARGWNVRFSDRRDAANGCKDS
jgi:hypothetical protein